MREDDQKYFERRAQQHRERAQHCADVAARRLHLQFAERYAARAGSQVAA